MKISVLTTKDGSIIATMRHDSDAAASGLPRSGFVAGPGQEVRQLELTAALAALASGDELHRTLKALLGGPRR